MIVQPAQFGALFLSVGALAGLLILQGVITARDGSTPLNRRFLFGLRITAVLFAGRALMILTGVEAFRFLVLLAAALIPLAVILLVEGLLRRHAPLWVKTFVALGTIAFVALSFWYSRSIDPARAAGLLVFQVSSLTIAGWLAVTRDTSSLSTAENQTVERLALSLVLLIPLAATDFLMLQLRLPVQFSPLAVLFLCWLTVSLGRSQSRHRAPLMSFCVIVLGAGLSGIAVAMIAGMGREEAMLTCAVILAAVLVAVLFIEAQTLRNEEQSQTLLRHLAEDRSADAVSFLRGLQSHPLVEGAALIQGGDLTDLDQDTLRAIFARHPVLRNGASDIDAGSQADHVTHLFHQFNASHILLADAQPLTLVALSMPAFATSPRAELELAAVQRMAQLMSRTHK